MNASKAWRWGLAGAGCMFCLTAAASPVGTAAENLSRITPFGTLALIIALLLGGYILYDFSRSGQWSIGALALFIVVVPGLLLFHHLSEVNSGELTMVESAQNVTVRDSAPRRPETREEREARLKPIAAMIVAGFFVVPALAMYGVPGLCEFRRRYLHRKLKGVEQEECALKVYFVLEALDAKLLLLPPGQEREHQAIRAKRDRYVGYLLETLASHPLPNGTVADVAEEYQNWYGERTEEPQWRAT